MTGKAEAGVGEGPAAGEGAEAWEIEGLGCSETGFKSVTALGSTLATLSTKERRDGEG